MASDIEQRNFVDKAGLEQFWDDIQTYMTRMYKGLPAGMQFSRIYQENGQLHILVEPFGGSTEDRKAASRANLGVYSKAEIDANYKTKQDGVTEQFTEYQTLLDISQDTNGEISVRKQVIPTATVGTLGLTTLKGVVSADDGDDSTAATPKAVADAIAATIAGLDVSEVSIGEAKTVGTISEVDGKIVVTAVDILVGNSNIANDAVTADKVKDGETLPVNISGNAATATTVEEGGELDQRIGALETGKKDKQGAKADPSTSGDTENFQFISTITQDANGEITATKHTIPKSDAIDSASSDTLATSKAVKSAIDSLNGTVQASSTNVSVSVTETAGKLTGITGTDTAATSDHVHGEINNDGTIGETADLAVVTGESGAVTVADLSTAAPVATGTDTAFVTTVSQDSKGKITAAKANLPEATTEHAGIVRLVDSYESNSTTMAPTANALKSAYEHSSQVIADLDYTNKLGNGQYITDLKQVNGLIDYGVANMATQPVQGDMKPITSGGVQNALLEEHDARVAFDAKIDSYLPDAVSSSNKLADKAYVDAIGERLEAHYLASSD
jgi:hypothetical protein